MVFVSETFVNTLEISKKQKKMATESKLHCWPVSTRVKEFLMQCLE